MQAGATFSDDTRTKMTGSWYLLREESVEKARERLSRDVYAKGGAWDMSRVRPTFARCTLGHDLSKRLRC